MRKLGKFQQQYFNLLVSGITLRTNLQLKGKRSLYESQYQRSFNKLLDIMVDEGYVLGYDTLRGVETVQVMKGVNIVKPSELPGLTIRSSNVSRKEE